MTETTKIRKLASIQKVVDVKPITFINEKWDLEVDWEVEEVIVQWWHFVAKKNKFKIGDFCVYFKIGSFLPINKPQFSFLLNKWRWIEKMIINSQEIKKMTINNQEVKGIRLKTIRLKGIISQWLALPLKNFKNEIKEVYKDIWNKLISSLANKKEISDSDINLIYKLISKLISKRVEELEWYDMTDILGVLEYKVTSPMSPTKNNKRTLS